MSTNGTAMVVAEQAPAAMARASVLSFTPEQEQMIRDAFANGASPSEFSVLMEIARARRLNPLLRQIHFVNRYDSAKGRKVWSTQVSIDGLRAIAERTGKYDGQDEPEYVVERGKLYAAKVRVYRKDWARPVVGVAHWDEYVQTTRDGDVTQFWKRMPRVMLAKCAEAIALRKAFPEDMSGLYVPEEMGEVARVERAPVSAPDLTSKLEESIEANWPAWEAKWRETFETATDMSELLELWADCHDEIKRLKPPKETRDRVVLWKDESKVRLLDEREDAMRGASE